MALWGAFFNHWTNVGALMTAMISTNAQPGTAPSDAAARDSARPDAGRVFRPEVQALRALAVLLVLVYHIDPSVLPGGYVGVDVFFVISGFLITGHLWREATTTGRVSLRKFWAARARRILPASLVATVGTILLALVLLPLELIDSWWRQALASVLYVENWALAVDAVDYQAANNQPTAFQHFWSLGVEEQFYLFWPLLVVLAVVLWRRTGARRGAAGEPAGPAGLRVALLVLFGSVTVASLVWGVLEVRAGNPTAYYSTLTRVWELGAGGIAALLVRDGARPGPVRNALAVAGLAGIVVVACLYDDATPFPGLYAVVPVLATLAVIVAGRTSGPGSLRTITESWAVQRIGDVSYSLYLWHFPVVVFFAVHTGRSPRPPEVLAMVALSFALAIASYVLVEQPVRRARYFRHDGRMLIAALLAMALVAGMALLLPARANAIMRPWDDRAATVAAEAGARVAAGQVGDLSPFVDGQVAIYPNPQRIADDKFPGTEDCLVNGLEHETPACEYGETEHPAATVALVGDSHAAQFTEPLLEIAAERDWRVVTYLHGSCPYSVDRRTSDDPALVEGCAAGNAQTRQALRELQPDLVLTSFLERTAMEPRGDEKVPGATGLAETWRELADDGAQVVVLRDTPLPKADAVRCVTDNYSDPQVCDQTREEAIGGRQKVPAAAALAPGTEVVDFYDLFCTESRCPAVIGNVMVYMDQNHVSRTYMHVVTDRLRQALPANP